MTVKELQDQLKLAKNKDAKVVFRIGSESVELETMAEVVEDAKGIHFPALGETTNAVAIKFLAPQVAAKASE